MATNPPPTTGAPASDQLSFAQRHKAPTTKDVETNRWTGAAPGTYKSGPGARVVEGAGADTTTETGVGAGTVATGTTTGTGLGTDHTGTGVGTGVGTGYGTDTTRTGVGTGATGHGLKGVDLRRGDRLMEDTHTHATTGAGTGVETGVGTGTGTGVGTASGHGLKGVELRRGDRLMEDTHNTHAGAGAGSDVPVGGAGGVRDDGVYEDGGDGTAGTGGKKGMLGKVVDAVKKI